MALIARAGKVLILASADGRRTPALPDIPTISELGIPGFDMASMLGALVPAGVPRDIVAKLNAGVVAAVASPEVHEKIAGFGVRIRSEERRVGKEGRSRWSPYHLKKKKR